MKLDLIYLGKTHEEREKEREEVRANQAKYMKERSAERQLRTDKIKLEAGCMDCGYNSHACALDFDHRPGETKLFQIAGNLCRKWESTLAEIAKCDVVCANCHRVRTKERQQKEAGASWKKNDPAYTRLNLES